MAILTSYIVVRYLGYQPSQEITKMTTTTVPFLTLENMQFTLNLFNVGFSDLK